MSKREQFCIEALKLQDLPYIWNKDGPGAFDCSGLVNYCLLLVGGPDWRASHNCARFLLDLPMTTLPKPGDLVLYGRPDNWHVMIYWGDGRVYGASGGNKHTLNTEDAKKRGACVKFKSDVDYRPDFFCYLTLTPLDQENTHVA